MSYNITPPGATTSEVGSTPYVISSNNLNNLALHDDGCHPSSSSPFPSNDPSHDGTALAAQGISAPVHYSKWYNADGKWTGTFLQCPKNHKKVIEAQIRRNVWSRGHFPGVMFSKEYPLEEEVSKEYMNWKYYARKAYRNKWVGHFKQLLEMDKEEQKQAIPPIVQRKWKQNEEVYESDLPSDFQKILSLSSQIVIETSRQPMTILAFRIPVPTKFIVTLRQTDGILPKRPPVLSNHGDYTRRHYALWADDPSKHPHMSKDFLEDGKAAQDWLSSNAPLFQYLGDELRLRDYRAYSYLKDTPWLNKLLSKGGVDLVERVPLQKMTKLWNGLAISQNQTKDGVAYRGYTAAEYGFNCIVPYGDWKGGDILLWNVRKRIELREGEALFVRGSVILHNEGKIQEGGIRNCVDLFTCGNLLEMDMQRRKHGRPGRKSPKDASCPERGPKRRRTVEDEVTELTSRSEVTELTVKNEGSGDAIPLCRERGPKRKRTVKNEITESIVKDEITEPTVKNEVTESTDRLVSYPLRFYPL